MSASAIHPLSEINKFQRLNKILAIFYMGLFKNAGHFPAQLPGNARRSLAKVH